MIVTSKQTILMTGGGTYATDRFSFATSTTTAGTTSTTDAIQQQRVFDTVMNSPTKLDTTTRISTSSISNNSNVVAPSIDSSTSLNSVTTTTTGTNKNAKKKNYVKIQRVSTSRNDDNNKTTTTATSKSNYVNATTSHVHVVVDFDEPKVKPYYYTEQQWNEKLQRDIRIKEIMIPYTNETTFGYFYKRFYSGYRNQIMAFSALIMWGTYLNGHRQLLMESLRFKDTFGSEMLMKFTFLFDVEHWNSYYPQLPRMVSCDAELYTDFDCVSNSYKSTTTGNSTKPYPRMGNMNHLFMMYGRYTKHRGPFYTKEKRFPNPIDRLIMSGALRPHPDLMDIINDKLTSLQQHQEERQHTNTNDSDTLLTNASSAGATSGEEQQQQGKQEQQQQVAKIPYFTLHARVEPDMQKHVVCRDLKVKNLTEIFRMLEETFVEPPAPHLFLPINRQMLESEGLHPNVEHPEKTNWIAVENLQALNHARQYGLWNGRVKTFEFGANALNGTKYETRPSTTGALINYHIAIGSTVFIGTEVSSYSYDLVSTRFYTGNIANYKVSVY